MMQQYIGAAITQRYENPVDVVNFFAEKAENLKFL
jgi:hypothetical protein